MIDTNSQNLASYFPKSVFYTSRQEFTENPLNLNVIEGELPPDLYGHLFLVAPVGLTNNKPGEQGWIYPTEDGTPLFNGDGMVYRLDFDEANSGKVKLFCRIAKTPCFYTDRILDGKDEEIKDRENIKDFINLGLARLSIDMGFRNQVNTAIIPMKFNEEEGYRLMMTWDAGRPYEINPQTLELVTAVGSNKEWDEQIDLQQIFEVVNTASHPAFDPDSENGVELFTVSFQKSISTWLKLISNKSAEDVGWELNNVKKTVENLEILTKQRRQLFSASERPNMELNELPERYQQIGQQYKQELEHISDLKIIDELLQVFRQMLMFDRINWVLDTLLEVFKGMKDYVKLIRWDGQSKLQTWKIVGEDKTSIEIPDSMHQIATTQDYLILANTVFKVGPEQLLPNLLPVKLPNLPLGIENPLNIALNHLNNDLRNFFSYPQSEKTDLYIIRRADLNSKRDEIVAKKVSVPMPFPHFMADYENHDDRITLHVAHNTGWDSSSWIRPYDSLATGDKPEQLPLGMASGSTDINHLGSYIIDLQDWDNLDKERVSLKGQLLSDKELTWMSAIATYYLEEGIKLPKTFKNIFWLSWGCWSDLLTDYVVDLYKNYPHRDRGITIDEVSQIAHQGVPANICRVDLEKGEIVDSYRFESESGSKVFANSPQFVPRQKSDSTVDESIDGYIVCVVNTRDSKNTSSEFHIFDAADLKRGAICKLKHDDLKLGMTLHSAWCPKIDQRKSSYKVDARQDYPLKAQVAPQVTSFFQEIINKYFPDGQIS